MSAPAELTDGELLYESRPLTAVTDAVTRVRRGRRVYIVRGMLLVTASEVHC